MIARAQAIRKPTILIALLACLATILISQTASAHANLLKASPEPSEVLDTSPERVIIWFTEPIEPAFSSISVLNPVGATVTSGDTEFDPTEPTAMWVPFNAPRKRDLYRRLEKRLIRRWSQSNRIIHLRRRRTRQHRNSNRPR